MRTLASHDYRTYTHCVHSCMFLVATAKGLLKVEDAPALNRIGLGGILHDIGKSRIPDAILSKPHKLTPAEFEEVKKHPLTGLEIARQSKRLPRVAAQIIRSHHERLDGSGYPDGLSAPEISQTVRLSSIIDVYDALTTDRPYARARTPYQALEMMMRETKGQLDDALLRAFVKFLGPT
jgi:putative nucleotidyltransferase with HDIG domain